MTRAEVADAANEIGRLSRYGGAPTVTEHSARETLCAWLQWWDPNGWHVDELAAIDDIDPYDLEGAWQAIADVVASDAE